MFKRFREFNHMKGKNIYYLFLIENLIILCSKFFCYSISEVIRANDNISIKVKTKKEEIS